VRLQLLDHGPQNEFSMGLCLVCGLLGGLLGGIFLALFLDHCLMSPVPRFL